jgi:hypothetical protein
MIASLVWKEYRQHRAVWLIMAAGAALALPALKSLAFGEFGHRAAETLLSACALWSWAYGVVCGAMLLAGEREDGTLPFLDLLPRTRRSVWAGKCLAGAALVLAQVAVLAVLAAGLTTGGDGWPWARGLAELTVAGLVGLGWGLLFSANGSGVFAVVGQAIGAQILTGFTLVAGVFLFVHALRLDQAGDPTEGGVVAAGLGALVLTGLAFAGSARAFCRPDRLRHPGATARDETAGWGGLVRLTWGESRGFARALLVGSAAAGVVVALTGALLWPIATLAVGLLCGVRVFGGQARDPSAPECRHPAGRVWVVRTCLHLALAGAAFLIILLVCAGRALWAAGVFNDADRPRTLLGLLLGDELLGSLAPPGVFLVMWVVNGFGLGQLCGLLLPTRLVAVPAGLAASLVAAGVWLPSLAGGGLHLWQAAAVPLLAVAASWLLLGARPSGPWHGARLGTRAAVGGGAAFLLAAGLVLAGGLAYRVAEIPEVDDLHIDQFLAGLPAPGQDEAGRIIRDAGGNLAFRRQQLLLAEEPTRPLFSGDPFEPNSRSFGVQVGQVWERGWPPGRPELAGWLDRLFAGPEERELVRAAGLSPGLVEDPRQLTMTSPLSALSPLQDVGLLLAARGLQKQAEGDAAAFLDDLRAVLGLSRTLRNHSPLLAALTARRNVRLLLQGLERWLERLDGRPDLLREALALLRRAEADLPADFTDNLRAEFIIARNTVEHPEALLVVDFRTRSKPHPLEVAAVAAAWQVPWEHARLVRLLSLGFAVNRPERGIVEESAPWMNRLAFPVNVLNPQHRAGELAELRARQLQVALRLYLAEKGRPAENLAALVPDYLPAVPTDPFDGAPFRYRLSAGEGVEWSPEERAFSQPGAPVPTREVPAGQGILWSVGPDGSDDGGRRRGPANLAGSGEDLLFLVPLPPRKG